MWAIASYCHGFVSPHVGRMVYSPTFSSSCRLQTVFSQRRINGWKKRRSRSRLFMSIEDSNDPFELLGLEEPTTDKKVIKRAYKRMALKYHPDVSTTQQSTPEEKKEASDRFAKINWAYEVLSGKRQNDSTYGSTTSSSSSKSTGTSGWSPPHRRSGAYSPPGESNAKTDYPGGVDWTDFMPKYDEAEYDSNGDSFGKIFSDLFVGAAAGAAGMGGPSIVRDFIEFLEGNVDGFGTNPNDEELRVLLQVGSLDEVRNELDDTELVVQQLKQKMTTIQEEIISLTAKVGMTSRYMEKIEMEEALAELNARKDVVQGYVKKAQKRLLTLQTRYKELLTGDDPYSSSRTRSSWDDIKREAGDEPRRSTSRQETASSSYSTSTRNGEESNPFSATSSTSTSTRSDRSSKTDDDAWMNEGFGSSAYGRGRGSGRRRSKRGSSSSEQTSARQGSTQRTASAANEAKEGRQSSSQGRQDVAASPNSSSSQSLTTTVPPHRRATSSYENRQEQDKRRMRELKVDEEFDKLKRELGL